MKIRVIPYRVAIHPETKNTCSPYGAIPDGYVITEPGSYTWELICRHGVRTVGLCRKPAKTYAEALKIAEKTGYELIKGFSQR